ncbi:MAG: hypothetical protein P8I82_07020 [Flavobacteriales bacterium]|nr:hypothetical protein [Flavobacteriales bacterium]
MLAHLFFKIKTYINYRLVAVNAHGLHSPFLFDFYNEVIVAKKEFYFFKQFRELISTYSKSTSEANALFLYRWASFYQPNSVFVPSGNFIVSLALSVPNAHKALSVSSIQCFSEYERGVFKQLDVSVLENRNTDLIYLDEIDAHTEAEISDYKCVIVYKPHENKHKDFIWENLCSLKVVTISIDLFQFGILLMNRNQAKQHFVVKMR